MRMTIVIYSLLLKGTVFIFLGQVMVFATKFFWKGLQDPEKPYWVLTVILLPLVELALLPLVRVEWMLRRQWQEHLSD